MRKSQAYRLIEAAEILSPIGDAAKAITTESQARELSAVPVPQRAAVVEKAILATGGKITAAAIREAAGGAESAIVYETPEVMEQPTEPKPAALVPLSFTELGKIAAVSTSTARRLIESGRIQSVGRDVLGRPLFNLADLEALRASRWKKVAARFLVAPTTGHRTLG
jgi:hypothetical protein